MSYIKLTIDQFEDFADELFSEENGFTSWIFKLPMNGIESVICTTFPHKPTLECHIYTTLDPNGKVRDKGEDAIRIILYDTKAGKAIKQYPKVLRTGNSADDVFERITERVIDMMEDVHELTFCKKCGSYMVPRVNRSTGESFMACGAYPNCGKSVPYALRSKDGTVQKPIEAKTMVQHVDVIPPQGKVPVFEDMTPLVEVEDCYPSSCYPHFQYGFDKFNRLQSTILQHGYWEQDCNLVLGTSTSTGKTISGELFVWETLKVHKKKVCYVSPLKSLTLEKFNDWNKSFGGEYKICILTGDFVLTDERAKELNEADLICLTSEMVDSRTRNHQSERSDWIFKVGLVITDESHIISTDRGHAVEVGLMRFCKLVPSARVLMLSATMPNVKEFKTWLTNLNGKPTEIINNNWRPTTLQWKFVPFYGTSYSDQQETKKQLTLSCLDLHPEEKALVFVHDKNTGRQLEAKLTKEGIYCKFHNADLELKDRIEVENSFESQEEDSLRVLISTSTLAWGRNLPAVNVIIVGTTRGINEVDVLDIIQMAGRAGRLGWSDIGRCYLICDNPSQWEFKVNHPRNITSTLLNKDILGFHVLAEISNKEIWNKETLKVWFSRSLAFIQVKLNDSFIDEVLEDLVKMKMLFIDEHGLFTITNLGKVSASLYFYPRDVSHWAIEFSKIEDNDLWKSDLAVSYALGRTPSFQLDYVPKFETDRVTEYSFAVMDTVPVMRSRSDKQSVVAADLYDHMTEQQGSHLYARQIKNDIDRIVGALSWIDSIRGWDRTKNLNIMALRIKHGVKAGIAQFCAISGIGAVRAKKLDAAGIKTLRDMIKNPEKVTMELGKTLAPKAIAQAKQIIRSQMGD